MAIAQRLDFVFQFKEPVHSNWRGCQVSRLLEGFVLTSSREGWVTHSIRLFPLSCNILAHRCVITFRMSSSSHTLYPLVYEDGTNRLFRNFGYKTPHVGEQPKRKHTTLKTRRKSEIKKRFRNWSWFISLSWLCRLRIFFVLLIPSVYYFKLLSNSLDPSTNHHSFDTI
jgi:hypothetical protein